jgi:hypothetical protein
MEKQLTEDDYIKKINKRFNQIGTPYSKPKTMAFMADGETQELEEPDNTFTSMNFVWKIIMEHPGKNYVLMNKEQAIRFIRVAKQRILKILNNDIDFINIHLSKDERRAFDKKTNSKFIEKLTNRIRDVAAKYNITDEDLYRDTPKILQTHIVAKMYEKPYVPDNDSESSPMYRPDEPSPEYKVEQDLPKEKVLPKVMPKPRVSRKSKVELKQKVELKEKVTPTVVLHSDKVKTNITEFQLEMEELDEQDKETHSLKKEEDTPVILESINSLKQRFLNEFTTQVYELFERDYDTDVKELNDKLIKEYSWLLVGIRNSAHHIEITGIQKYNKTRIDVRKEKEIAQKLGMGQKLGMAQKLGMGQKLEKEKKIPKPRASRRIELAPTAFAVTDTTLVPPALAPVPRTRKTNPAVPNPIVPNPAVPNPAVPNRNTMKKKPVPRTRKTNVQQMNVKQMNVKKANAPNLTRKSKPKAPPPKSRQSKKNKAYSNAAVKFNQPNTTL